MEKVRIRCGICGKVMWINPDINRVVCPKCTSIMRWDDIQYVYK